CGNISRHRSAERHGRVEREGHDLPAKTGPLARHAGKAASFDALGWIEFHAFEPSQPGHPGLEPGAVWGAGAEQELPAAVRAAGWSPVRGCPEYLPWQAVERVEATGFVRRGRRGRRVK